MTASRSFCFPWRCRRPRRLHHRAGAGGDPNLTLVLLDGTPLNDSTDLEGGTFDLASLR